MSLESNWKYKEIHSKSQVGSSMHSSL